MKCYILEAKENNVFKNLAYEASILDFLEKTYLETNESVCALLLWSNDNTIVIGRNQNIYKECNIEFCKKNNISIARRRTGGGAVFHDLGNLNFTFFASKDIYNIENNYSIIQNALKHFKIDAEKTGRNDLTIQKRKFSGSAFYNTKNLSMHHGTILIDSPSAMIETALTPSKIKLQSHSVNSVKSRIINLTELNSNITPQSISKALIESFKRFYNIKGVITSIEIEKKTLRDNYNTFISDKWIFNTKIETNFQLTEHFDWGEAELQLLVKNGKIECCNVYTDSLTVNITEELKSFLTNAPLNKNEFEKHYNEYLRNCKDVAMQQVLADILTMLESILI